MLSLSNTATTTRNTAITVVLVVMGVVFIILVAVYVLKAYRHSDVGHHTAGQPGTARAGPSDRCGPASSPASIVPLTSVGIASAPPVQAAKADGADATGTVV